MFTAKRPKSSFDRRAPSLDRYLTFQSTKTLAYNPISAQKGIKWAASLPKETAIMGVLDSLNDVLKNYRGGQAQDTENATEHFDQVAQAAPHSVIAEGLAAAFRSDQTPAFGNIVGNLFSQSSGEQKAGILNQLLASVGPGVLAQLAGGATPTRLPGSAGQQITPDQAQAVSPEVVQQLATHAENSDPSIIDKASAFYAQHSTLVKTLGGAALTIALAKVAERQRAA